MQYKIIDFPINYKPIKTQQKPEITPHLDTFQAVY